MKTIFKKISAAAASAVIAACSVGSSISFGADTSEIPTYIIHYELGDDVTIVPDEDGNVPELGDEEKPYNSAVFITDAKLKKDGYYFSGWTADDIYGYNGGMVYRVPDHDVTLKPVWTTKGDKDVHTVKFSVEYDDEVKEEYEKLVPAQKGVSGSFIEIPMYVFPRDGYKQSGWTDGTNVFVGQQFIILHDEDITLYPNWKKKYKLTYSVGDADRINGTTMQEYEVMEDGSVELQASDRFSRNGFKISGWHCETDGKDYKPYQTFIMPSSDVVMTPIWEPINYTIVFDAGLTSNDDVRVKGKTDTTIIIPECTSTKEGYTFGGWKKDDTVYQPGDEYLVLGAKPGIGISFKAVWNEEGKQEETAKAFEIKVVDKESGEPVNDVWLSASSFIYEGGAAKADTFPIDTAKENPKKVSYTDLDEITKVEVGSFRIVEDIYNGFAYKLDENDIEEKIENGTAYYTVKLSKKVYPDDVKPYSHVVRVYEKGTSNLIKDVTVTGNWEIEYEGKVTGPVQIIDTSAANPAILSYEKYKDATSCGFMISDVYGDTPYMFNRGDYIITKDDENHIIYHNVYLIKRNYGDANCDGNVDMADVVLIMQALANPDKYDLNGTDENHITFVGRANADVEPSVEGLTTEDALTIQKYLLKKIDALPLVIDEPVID